jgi:RNA polymerase sigma-70 factor (ECF subfamily)
MDVDLDAAVTDAPRGDPAPDDAAIVLQSVTQPEAFAALFRRHSGPIGRYLARRIGPQDAQDVLADVFLEAFRQRGRYDTGKPDARPWLYGIATRRLGRYRRSELKQFRVLERTGLDPVVASFTDVSDARVGAGQAVRMIAEVLRGLPAGHREALLLLAWTDLTYEEIAAALKVPVGTVRSRVSRARKALRDAFGGVDPTGIPEEAQGE